MDDQAFKIAHTYRLRQSLAAGITVMPELVVTGSEQEHEMAPHICSFYL